ncbi:MAG: LuxR C-terminal-related transcriptional regulator [Burkholderiales bacterium]|nr:LuxR C-terminal-related transcriptional regulator [Burkholderiales bacterium]
MHLTGRQADVLGRVMSTLAEPHAEADIRSELGVLMLDLLGAQFYASYVWNDALVCFDSGVQINMDAANLLQYERYYQFHDPITLKLQQHRRAVRVTDVLAQEHLSRTEFFNDFLARDGLHWGVNLYAWNGERNIGDMRIWRDRRRENFDANDLALLDLVRPAFVAALRRSRRDLSDAPRPAPTERSASSLLSVREGEVAGLAACGLHDKEIARRLGISITTVRTHMDHAFRKLGVTNRMMLVQRLAR